MKKFIPVLFIMIYCSSFGQSVHLSASSNVINVAAGQSQQIIISITPSGGFNQQLFFTADPSGTSNCFSSAIFSVNPVIYPYTNGDTLTVSAAVAAIPAQCTIQIWAANGPTFSDTLEIQVNIIASNCYFTQISSLFANYNCLFANQNGLWIGGYSLYNFNTVNPVDYHNASGVTDITEDSQHNIWTSTSNGINKFDGTYWSSYNTSNTNFSTDFFGSIAVDSLDHVWATAGNYSGLNFPNDSVSGLYTYDGNSWNRIDSTNAPVPSNRFSKVTFDKNGLLWVYVYSYALQNFLIYNFDGTTWTLVNYLSSCLPLLYMNKMHFDSQNNAWFGIYNNGGTGLSATQVGLIKFKGSSAEIWCDSSLRPFNHIKYDQSCNVISEDSSSMIPDVGVRSVFVDHLDRVWIASSGSGISMYDGNNFQDFNTQNSTLNEDVIFSFAEYGDNLYYINNYTIFGGITDYGYYSCGLINTINENKSDNLILYPNPSSGEIFIKFKSNNVNLNLKIYDLTGQLLLNRTITQENNLIQLAHFNSGVYEYIANDGQQQYTGRFILDRN